MKTKSAVLEEFKKPLVIKEFDIAPLKEGEMLVRIESAGVCGSDVHMWNGNDPRTPLPLIPGHEGVGIIEDMKGRKRDITGSELKKGDFVIWNRGLTCGECFFCVVKKKPFLCPKRQTYGISISCSKPPYLNGCYSEYIHLRKNTQVLKITDDVDPSVLVTASCSGATTAHAFEMSNIKEGDTVVIQGPGPIGIFATVFALEMGATNIIVIGTKMDKDRLSLCRDFGATDTIVIDDTTPEGRTDYIKSKTAGLGAEVVVECSGNTKALDEGIQMVMMGGTYLIPGIATPTGNINFDVFRDIARKNVNIQGVWVSDASHLYQAVRLVSSKKYPFEKLVTHRVSLQDATFALELVSERKALKAVIIPQHRS